MGIVIGSKEIEFYRGKLSRKWKAKDAQKVFDGKYFFPKPDEVVGAEVN